MKPRLYAFVAFFLSVPFGASLKHSCINGILSDDGKGVACCPKKCSVCGGRQTTECWKLGRGCCASDILLSGKFCKSSTETACIVRDFGESMDLKAAEESIVHGFHGVSPIPGGALNAPKNNAEFAQIMVNSAMRNHSLLEYIYPSEESLTTDAKENWVSFTANCEMRNDCWCSHVEGDMSFKYNPDGWKRCAKLSSIESCNSNSHECMCLRGDTCLFSDMRPSKILAIIASARAAGVTHIIEEGRFGGLSAFMYSLHGFDVTSVEFLPLSGPTKALHLKTPNVKMLTGDGSLLVPSIVGNLTVPERARTMVIFDGEKRFGAYKTFMKIKEDVALVVFDDTNHKSEGKAFIELLRSQGHVFFDTRHPKFRPFIERETIPLKLLEPLQTYSSLNQAKFIGDAPHLARFHFTIVKASLWN